MGRVGTSIEEQVSSGGFRFEEGNGLIVAAIYTNDQVQGYDAKCGLKVSIQRMTKDWKPTSDDPVEEFLAAGPLVNKAGEPKFHPGNAKSSDDPEPEDCGDEVGVEGNCLYVCPESEGAQIDKKSKLAIFSKSLQEQGVKPTLLNGYAPNLVGIKAHFKQLMLEKGANFSGKNDPTCLVVDSIANLSEVNGGTAGKAKAAAATGKPTAAGKPTAGKPAPAAAKPAPAPAAASGDVNEEAEAIAFQLLVMIAESSGAGQTITRQKIGSKLVTLLAKQRVNAKLHKPVQALINQNDEWFTEKATDLGWTIEGAEVTFPAAEEEAAA